MRRLEPQSGGLQPLAQRVRVHEVSEGFLAVHEEKATTMREAAYALAVGRVTEATIIRGLYP